MSDDMDMVLLVERALASMTRCHECGSTQTTVVLPMDAQSALGSAAGFTAGSRPLVAVAFSPMGHIVQEGLWEPGSVVELRRVDQFAVRAEHGTLVDKKIADKNGDVGFTGVDEGARHFAVGYKDGFPLEVQCIGKKPGEGAETRQRPAKANVMKVGGQESVLPSPPAGAPAAEVVEGVSEELRANVAGEEPEPRAAIRMTLLAEPEKAERDFRPEESAPTEGGSEHLAGPDASTEAPHDTPDT